MIAGIQVQLITLPMEIGQAQYQYG